MWVREEPEFNSILVQNVFLSFEASRPTPQDTIAFPSNGNRLDHPRGKEDATGCQLLTTIWKKFRIPGYLRAVPSYVSTAP
jgi:hypothetical protein